MLSESVWKCINLGLGTVSVILGIILLVVSIVESEDYKDFWRSRSFAVSMLLLIVPLMWYVKLYL